MQMRMFLAAIAAATVLGVFGSACGVMPSEPVPSAPEASEPPDWRVVGGNPDGAVANGQLLDGGPSVDVGQTVDGGAAPDAAQADASVSADAGMSADASAAATDAGLADAGVSADSGPRLDATVSADAGSASTDVGSTDVRVDAANADSGAATTDTGTASSDAAVATDAGSTDTGGTAADASAVTDAGMPQRVATITFEVPQELVHVVVGGRVRCYSTFTGGWGYIEGALGGASGRQVQVAIPYIRSGEHAFNVCLNGATCEDPINGFWLAVLLNGTLQSRTPQLPQVRATGLTHTVTLVHNPQRTGANYRVILP